MKTIKEDSKRPSDNKTVMLKFIPDKITKNTTCELSNYACENKIPFTDVVDGMCKGYTQSEQDDEPHDECKKCVYLIRD